MCRSINSFSEQLSSSIQFNYGHSHLSCLWKIQVGDPNRDHKCWQRAEDMNGPRPVYKVTPSNPGSDVAGETAAALAAASLVFKNVDAKYSMKLLDAAKKAFAFADTYRGSYSDSLASVVCPFYCSYSGYQVTSTHLYTLVLLAEY